MSYGNGLAADNGSGAALTTTNLGSTRNLTLQNSEPRKTVAMKPHAKATPQRGKAGHSARAVAERRKIFVEAYLANGHNASQAAIAAGTGGKQPRAEGWKLLQDPAVKRLLAERAKQVAKLAEMNTASWAVELRAVAFSNVGDLFDAEGKLIPLTRLPRHVQAALSSVKVTNDGSVLEYKFWDKAAALNIMARHLGLFERDNAQQSDITVRVELVG